MSRWKAFGIHFALSLLVIGAIATLVGWRWYPPGLFEMAKAGKLLLTLAVVNMVIGPLLTLIVFKAGKKSLKFDLTVIALLQIAALAYGLNIMWQSRPVYLVGVVDRFELVFANELDPIDIANADPAYRVLPWSGPLTVGARLPTDKAEALRVIQSGFAGKDVHQMPAYYAEYRTVVKNLLTQAVPVETLAGSSPAARSALEARLGAAGLSAAQARALPIVSARGRATMLVRADTGALIGPVAVEPWPELLK